MKSSVSYVIVWWFSIIGNKVNVMLQHHRYTCSDGNIRILVAADTLKLLYAAAAQSAMLMRTVSRIVVRKNANASTGGLAAASSTWTRTMVHDNTKQQQSNRVAGMLCTCSNTNLIVGTHHQVLVEHGAEGHGWVPHLALRQQLQLSSTSRMLN